MPLRRSGKEVTPGIPGIVYAGFQCMYPVMAAPLTTGAFADRFRFKPFLLFIVTWVLLVYSPVCHWVWGGGWMSELGIFDFAGGIVVNINAGFSALATSLFISGRSHEPIGHSLHNVPLVCLGTAMIWLSWFGFCGGSAFLSGGVAVVAVVNTQLAASTSATVWMLIEWYAAGKPSIVGLCIGSVAGLAAVTPAAGFIQPANALFLGAMSAPACWLCIKYAKMSDICQGGCVKCVGLLWNGRLSWHSYVRASR
jgi:Amt family ammonium transporter